MLIGHGERIKAPEKYTKSFIRKTRKVSIADNGGLNIRMQYSSDTPALVDSKMSG